MREEASAPRLEMGKGQDASDRQEDSQCGEEA